MMFFNTLKSKPEFTFELLQIMSYYIKQTDENIFEMGQKTLEQRAAKLVLSMKDFFELPLETKQKYSYRKENNLGYSVMGAENVDPTAPKDMKESFNYNNTRMPDELWPNPGWVPGFKHKALESIKIADRLALDILQKFDTILSCGTTLVDAHDCVCACIDHP